ncbi:MAG: AarF/UbiB family protein [Alphaproteobacteria bacterium]
MLNAFRLARAGFVLARAGAFGLANTDDMPPGPARLVALARRLEPKGFSDAERGERLSDALNRLGPSYVKFGQFLATRPDLVGSEAAQGLSVLKDDMAPFPTAIARQILTANIGREIDDVFESFGPPVAAASIAQVHRARLLPRPEPDVSDPDPGDDAGDLDESDERAGSSDATGDDEGDAPADPAELEDSGPKVVAVKILRPDVRARFARDLSAFFAAARFVERIVPDARRLKPVAVVETLERSVILEMDLRLEAAALSEMAENTAGDDDFRVPAVDWELTGRDVLVTEWVDAIRLVDLDAIDKAELDRPALAKSIMQSFLRHALRDGFFHADMHEGNLFTDTQGHVIAVDLGIMGRLRPKERRFLAEILYGFIKRDYQHLAQVHFDAGYVPAKHAVEDFAQALRAIGEPIHGQKSSDISMARLLQLLFEITDIFDMETRPELILLQKTMVVVEGVARRLDPEFDMWSTSEPIVAGWIARHLGPGGKLEDAVEGLAALSKFAGQMPELARRAERLSAELETMGASGLKLDAETVASIGAAEARHTRSGRLALWVIAGAALLVAIATFSMV